MELEPKIWGPHYWFVLFSIALSYPTHANNVVKKKYYDFIQNFPLFIPHREIGNDFMQLIDTYPITPYLDNRDSFLRWVHFIHNRVNITLGKEEISLKKALEEYYIHYESNEVIQKNTMKITKYILAWMIVCFVIILVFYYYNM
jgi:hypothetical protein